jgi:hypothetical protein
MIQETQGDYSFKFSSDISNELEKVKALCKGTVTLELFDVQDDASFFTIKGLPQKMLGRFVTSYDANDVNVFKRKCYQEMMEEMFRVSNIFVKPWYSITGTSGIGKSYFFLYLLYCYLKNSFPDIPSSTTISSSTFPKIESTPMKWSRVNKSFLYQINNEVFFFNHKGGLVFNWYLLQKYQYDHISDALASSDIPFFTDLGSTAYPLWYYGCQILFSSFNDPRLHEKEKMGTILTMPEWSMDELDDLTSCSFFQNITPFAFNPSEFVHQQYLLFGGSLGNIMRSSMSHVNTAITEVGKTLCDHLFTSGFGRGNQHNPDILIHRNPPVDENGNFLYSGPEIVYSFASVLLFTKLYAKYRDIIITQACAKYINGLSYSAQDEDIFESLSFLCFKLSGRYNVKSLAGGKDIILKIPDRMEFLPNNWKVNDTTFIPKLNTLFYPVYKNMESGDAFYVISEGGVNSLVIIQATTRRTHPVKANGLNIIFEICSKICDISTKVLVFLTPPNPCLNTLQNIYPEKDDMISRIPSAIGDFQTNQYLLVNSLLPKDDSEVQSFFDLISHHSVERNNIKEGEDI